MGLLFFHDYYCFFSYIILNLKYNLRKNFKYITKLQFPFNSIPVQSSEIVHQWESLLTNIPYSDIINNSVVLQYF